MNRTAIKDTVNKVGETVTVYGWVNAIRKHGKIAFLDLRDRSGLVQAVDLTGEAFKKIGNEYVLKVVGLIKSRPEKMINPKIVTGTIEMEIKDIEVISTSLEPPFPLDTDGYDINEESRIKYRYLDLRRPRMLKNMLIRFEVTSFIRNFLKDRGFKEIETPYFTSTTPEGSRDFVVPSRMYPGKFFALPQSPQQYKQLLMVAGFERYFQIARCFRDEDLRADRGFEHTQIDIEMSFATRNDIMALDEELITLTAESMGYKIKQKPFPVFSCKEAIDKFGADKFDLRDEDDKKNGILAFAWVIDFPFFEKDKEGKWTFTHNPFSMPAPEHLEWHMEGVNIDKIATQQYDLVCNGFEVGGGSVRAHKPEILRQTFKIMGYTEEQINKDFSHMMEAFSYGAPPHGGIAHGIERLIMILTNESELREVQTFPQTSSGRTSVMDAPGEISKDQLKELGIEIQKRK